jgi:cytochrome b
MNTAPTPSLPGRPASARGTTTPCLAARRRVTDAAMRMFHALFALSFALAWATGDSEHWRALHVTLGYTMVGLLAFRVVYGFVGPRPARWSSLASRLAGAPAWWRAAAAGLRRGEMPWRQGQNLLMAAVAAALLLVLAPLALSGYATYADWGGDWLEEVHEAFANAMLGIVMLHLGLIALLSALRRQNLALPMLTGRVYGSGPDLVPAQRQWLAGLLLAAVIGFGAWQWSETPHGLLPTAAHGEPVSAGEGDDD